MATRVRVSIWFCLLASVLFAASICYAEEGEVAKEEELKEEFVLTLDHSNFSETVTKHPFIVVEFYAPWCGHCKSLAPEYEKAASELSSHDPPIILAKVDANEEANKGLASEYEVQGFPTIKILRNGGKNAQEYKGPREADGIVSYLKKQVGPASVEIKSAEEADNLISGKLFIVGLFPSFSGEEYENFIAVSEKMRADYAFGHTSDAKLLPRGDAVKGPLVRLFKPFDELSVDSQDFHVDSLEKFVEDASVPSVTIFNKDPNNHLYVVKYFNTDNAKVMLFLNFTSELGDAFKSKFQDVANQYKGKGLSFLIGDLEASQGALQYFSLKDDQVPLIIIQKSDGEKYLKANLAPADIAPWLKEYTEGNVKPFKKSEPIPETNNEPVKVVVAESLQEIVFNSGKNVLLEFYAPWCGHCKKLAPILEEVAISFQGEEDVVIAKLDATANDIPLDAFQVKGYPTIYFISASGNLVLYDGGRTKEDIIEFIQKNKNKSADQVSTEDELKDEPIKEESPKDEPIKEESPKDEL